MVINVIFGIRVRTAKAQRYRRSKKRQFVNEYKRGKQCLFCKEKNHSDLTFHHINKGTKLFTLGRSAIHKSYKQIEEEINKCVLVCRPCHLFFYHKGFAKYANQVSNKVEYYEAPEGLKQQVLLPKTKESVCR